MTRNFVICLGLVAAAAAADIDGIVRDALEQARANHLDTAEKSLRGALTVAPESASVLYALGLVRLQQGDVPEARDLLVRCIRSGSASPEPRLALARAEWRLGQRAEAERTLQDAINLARQSAPILFGAGIMYRDMGLHAMAAEAFGAAVPLSGADPAPRIALVRSLIQASQTRHAAELASAWRSQSTGTAVSHTEIGIAFAEARMYQDAIEEFRAALRDDAKQIDAGYNLALAFYYHQQFPEAEKNARLLLKQQESALVRHLLGLILEQTGRRREAAAEFERAAGLTPGSADSLVHVGRIALQEHRYVEAQSAFAQARSRCSGSECAEALIGQGTVYKLHGKHADAAAAFEDAIKQAPRNFVGYLYLGDAFIRARRYEDAAAALRKAIELEPASSLSHYMYAYALMGGAEDAAEAVAHLKEAIRLDPANGLAYYRLGLIESKAGKYKSAAPLLMRATELEPKLKEAHYQLAMAFQKMGKQDLARQEFSLYRSLTQSAVEEAARMGMEFERTTRP